MNRKAGKSGDEGCALHYPGKKERGDTVASTRAARLVERGVCPPAPGKDSASIEGWKNILIHGDNLPALKTLLLMKEKGLIRNSDGSSGARLIYIDPPFSTKLNFRDTLRRHAYEDKLSGAEFLEFMRRRLILMREILSSNGSIYVHLDWKKAHYVKVLLDEVFGEENFLNDIVWDYGGRGGRGAKAVSGQFARNHDIILLYRKGSHVFNREFLERRVVKGANGFKKDSSGRWFKTSPRGDYTDESVKALDKEGRVYRTRNGNIRIKYFLREYGDYLIEDIPIGDVWDDIPDAMHMRAGEKTGYPTQKPEALLERAVKASSNSGDIVLDAFAGSGTTLAVAEKLGRRWIGIDSGRLSISTIKQRLLNAAPAKTSLKDPEEEPHPRPFIIYRALT